MAGIYETHIQGKTAEDILAHGDAADSNQSPYLQAAAQIRSNQELINALTKASQDSTNIGRRIVWLTCVLVVAGLLQALATGWNKLASWGNKPNSWKTEALTAQWSDVKYLLGANDRITGFLLQYGVKNNTNYDYQLRKEGVIIMMNPADQKDLLIPADFNYSIARNSFFLPAHETSLVELHLEGTCNSSKETAKPCFLDYTRRLGAIVLFDQSVKLRINLPKPNRTNW